MFLIAPIMIFVSLYALWENEGRFDYYAAAKKTTPIFSVSEANSKETISFSGDLDQNSSIKGEFFEAITGYLNIESRTEIYAYVTERRGNTYTTTLKWSYSVSNIIENNNITKTLKNNSFLADSYHIKELKIEPTDLHFADEYIQINPSKLTLNQKGKEQGLKLSGNYFYKRKNNSNSNTDSIGDERISYWGIPNADTASYFGLIKDNIAIGKQFDIPKSSVSFIIKDDGILHHLVNYERSTALNTIKEHMSKLMWTVRLVATLFVCIGFYLLLSPILVVFMFSNVLTAIASYIILFISIVVGVTVSVITILLSIVYHNIISILCISAVIFLVFKLAGKKISKTKNNVAKLIAKKMTSSKEQAEANFLSLSQLAMADNKLDKAEKKFLAKWGKNNNLSVNRMKELFKIAKNETPTKLANINNKDNLISLICLALKDGTICSKELKYLYAYGDKMGFSNKETIQLINDIESGKEV